MSDDKTEKVEAPEADDQGVEQALYPEVELGGEPEKPEAEPEIESETKEEKARTPGRVPRVIALVMVGILLLACGVMTGAWMQRRGNTSTWTQLGEDLAVGNLVNEDGGVDLTTSLLLSQLENKGKDKETDTNETVLNQLVDGSGGGKLVGSVALMPRDDKLTLELLKLHNETKNSCYSPLSIRYALEMLRLGAGGETKVQIERLLGTTEATHYENVADHMSIANSLWIRNDFVGEVKASYQEALKSKFGAEIMQDSFQTATNINRWIENKSFGMLKNVLQDGDIQNLHTILANVLAIDMNWEREFMKESTSGQYFDFNYASGAVNERYTTINGYGGNDEYYNLAAEATVFAKDLKEYNGTRLQFVAIMPSNDLTEFIQNTNNDQINRLLVGLRRAVGQNDTYRFSFSSYIPKFSMKSGIDNLVDDLKKLGVTDAFDADKADFSGITEADLVIEDAAHKTNFDFSEEGIRAAAVTLLGGRGAGGDGPIPSSAHIVVSINKPFLYLVRDTKTGEIWFAGTVYKPNLWKDDQWMYRW